MKIKRNRRLIVNTLIGFLFFISFGTLEAQDKQISLIPYGGVAFGRQKVVHIVEQSEINDGLGYHGGVCVQMSNFWVSATYLFTSHTYKIQREKVTLKFSDMLFGAGIDLLTRNAVRPFIQAIFALPNMQDKELDGFKSGKTLGLGAGLKLYFSDRLFIGISGIYGLNKYKKFEVEEVSSVNQDNVKGNYLLLLGSIGFRFNLQ